MSFPFQYNCHNYRTKRNNVTMKKYLTYLLDRFQLSHIRWMLIGILLTEFITWLLYKDPKKITAPGLSAMVAVCALFLAIYSAYQVKKWIYSKVNDKGFKKCEAIIDKIHEIAILMLHVNPIINRLHNSNLVLLSGEDQKKIQDELMAFAEKLKVFSFEINTHYMHLNIWGFEMSDDFKLEELNLAIKEYQKSIYTTVGNTKHTAENTYYQEAENDSKLYKDAVKHVGYYMDKLNNSEFNEVFVEYKKPIISKTTTID